MVAYIFGNPPPCALEEDYKVTNNKVTRFTRYYLSLPSTMSAAQLIRHKKEMSVTRYTRDLTLVVRQKDRKMSVRVQRINRHKIYCPNPITVSFGGRVVVKDQ